MNELTKFDSYLSDDGPAALVIREWLMPAEGADGVLFPATFAEGDNFPGGYNIDVHPADSDVGPSVAALIKEKKLRPNIDMFPGSKNVCLVDSVGSQANRIEPIFATEKFKHLVPQIVVRVSPEKEISIFEAGHRAGDALVRCSSLQSELQGAFKAVLAGNAEPLARVAPTSLVFGVWDSRDTQAKLPRLIASAIRAYDVRKLTRSAQFNPATEFVNEKLLDEPTDKATKDAYAERGFIHVPASGSHGGVIADGGIRRDATLGLAALRLLHVGKDKDKTIALRRYILGLALVAFTHNPAGYLRQGCLLVRDKDKPYEFVEVLPTGDRNPVTIASEDALKYATAVAEKFGVAKRDPVDFDKDGAKRDVRGEAAEGGPTIGPVKKIAASKKEFTVKSGKSNVKVKVNDATTYFKANAASTFEAVVVLETPVVVEIVDGVAVKVTAQ
jgi:CRISPR-associated protein Csb1